MSVALFVLVGGNAALFSFLAVWAIRTALRDPSPRIRSLASILAVVCIAFVLGAATRLALLAVRSELLPGSVGDFLVSGWQLLQSVGALAAGGVGLWLVLRLQNPLREAEEAQKFVKVLSDRFPSSTPISSLGLTARELEVLESIADGKMSDKNIAESLYISPSTAGTHVKNIMRKAGVSNRRDLLMLAMPPTDGQDRIKEPTG